MIWKVNNKKRKQLKGSQSRSEIITSRSEITQKPFETIDKPFSNLLESQLSTNTQEILQSHVIVRLNPVMDVIYVTSTSFVAMNIRAMDTTVFAEVAAVSQALTATRASCNGNSSKPPPAHTK